ncbi:MAG TPA: hypothetical protein VH912_06210 [Streptosporangiaceae bacterium]
MANDYSGDVWRGEHAADLAEYLREFEAGGYRVGRVVEAVCAGCTSTVFRLRVDATEGCAERTCAECGKTALMLDSEDYWDGAEPEPVVCPCGGDRHELAVAFSMRANGDVRWVSVGQRCTRDGVLGCPADWKIDYAPSGDLLERV